MNPLERAQILHAQADALIAELRLAEIFAPHGGLFRTGSYLLDLLAYPDLDLYVPPMSVAQIFAAGSQIVSHPLVRHFTFDKNSLADLPGGLFFRPIVHFGDWERPWKIDIWSIEQDIIDAKLSEVQRLRALLTPELRALILNFKDSVLTTEGRTPVLSGYRIYCAVLDEGLRQPEAIRAYLRQHGIPGV